MPIDHAALVEKIIRILMEDDRRDALGPVIEASGRFTPEERAEINRIVETIGAGVAH